MINMQTKFKVTVVTITYNHENYIAKMIDSIVNQKTNFDYELIISDDCSTDNTAKIIKEYVRKYPKIIKPIFRKKNLGSMPNFIETLSEVKSKYVALCDGDDFWVDNDKLQKQVDFLEQNPDYNICFHQTKVFFDDQSQKEIISPIDFKETSTFEDLLKECYISANTVMYRWQFNSKKNVRDVLPCDIIPGDYFIHLYHAKNGKIKFIKEVMSNYRRHQGGIWWLTSQLDRQDEFYSKFGRSYLNFFKHVENFFGLPNTTFIVQKEWLVEHTIKGYLSEKKFEELCKLKSENLELFEKYIKNFDLIPIYYRLSKFKKFLYLLFFDYRRLKEKFKKKGIK